MKPRQCHCCLCIDLSLYFVKSSTHTPSLPSCRGLLLKCLAVLCLNWEGPLLGVTGPPSTRVGEVGISARLLLDRAEEELLLLLLMLVLLILLILFWLS